MTYAPITKLDNFTGKEDDAQIWLNDVEKAIAANGWNDARAMQAIPYFLKDTANSWYQSLINKPQDFNAFKAEFLRYFSNNNSINCLVNAFTIMKQGEIEAFIHDLCSSILQHVCLLHPSTLQDAVTCARDFESAESEANHIQAVNLVMNGPSELDSKLEKFSESINKKLEEYLADKHETLIVCKINHVHLHQPINIISLLISSVSSSNLLAAAASNISTTATNYLSTPTNSNTTPESSSNDIRQPLIQKSCTWNLDTSRVQNPNFQHYLSLLVNPEDATSNNMEFNQHVPTNTIPLATISSDESLVAIFPFELEENTLIPLFSGATLKEKPITAMYTDARVDSHRVDRAASARIITANGATKTPIGKIDDFPIEINGIIVPIKVLVMDTT
ncbi:hypothetical protein G9A89_012046 [Geosiphon pyriformis]|nr:hypothetical protein G9A89_012046 [Geosiphon pyriformis]